MPRSRSTAVVGSPAAASETAICTLPVSTFPDQAIIDLHATVDITIGTSGTAVTLKVRQGSGTTGTTIATYGPFTVTAADRRSFSLVATDPNGGALATNQYTLTATVTAGAATSTVNAVELIAVW